jgi:uncharacterized protein involved in type VI secretion and phage assembly
LERVCRRPETPLGKNALIPLRARGSARIGRDYSWTIDIASLRDDTALFSLMHQPVTLWIQQQTPYWLIRNSRRGVNEARRRTVYRQMAGGA